MAASEDFLRRAKVAAMSSNISAAFRCNRARLYTHGSRTAVKFIKTLLADCP